MAQVKNRTKLIDNNLNKYLATSNFYKPSSSPRKKLSLPGGLNICCLKKNGFGRVSVLETGPSPGRFLELRLTPDLPTRHFIKDPFFARVKHRAKRPF